MREQNFPFVICGLRGIAKDWSQQRLMFTHELPGWCRVVFIALSVLGPNGCAQGLDVTPTHRARSRAEAEEAFRRLVVAPRASDEERERLSLIVYQAPEGPAICAQALCSHNEEERALARAFVARVVTAEEGWHQYQQYISTFGLYEEVAIQNLRSFIEAPEPDLYMLSVLFDRNVGSAAFGAEHVEEVKRHPLLVWYQATREKIECGRLLEDPVLKQEKVRFWREWAKEHADTLPRELDEYARLIVSARAPK